MRTIAIIGAGEFGLTVAHALQKHGKYSVSLYSNQTSKQILNGRITSSQGMFDSALEIGRKLGLNYWDNKCPWNTSVSFTLGVLGEAKKGIFWQGQPSKPYQSIDQRLKFSRWMDEYEKAGGRLYIQNVGMNDLNTITRWHDLTIVAGGKGDVVNQCFARDEKRSAFKQPMRALSCIYVKDVIPVQSNPGVRANIIPGIGEFFIMPGLTLNDTHCEMMLFEGILGAPFDCWDKAINSEEQLVIAKKLLKEYVPWEYERCAEAKLTDDKATLLGKFPPTVRIPIKQMPNDKFIFAGGDAAVANDPIAGQGSNTAAKCASILVEEIRKQDDRPFDEFWMKSVFEKQWQLHIKAATEWSNLLLLPPPPHVIELLIAASNHPEIADKLANGFDNPNSLFPWIKDPIQTKSLIEEIDQIQTQVMRI